MSVDSLSREELIAEKNAKSVAQLAELVKKSDYASIDDISELIAKDDSLKSRTIRIAFGSKADAADTPIEGALNQLGVGIIEILAMGDLLVLAVENTFELMLDRELVQLNHEKHVRSDDIRLISTIEFDGVVFGKMYLDFPSKITRMICAGLLGMDPSEVDKDLMADTLSEFVNIIAGKLQSNISDAGLKCNLGLPLVSDTTLVSIEKIPGAKKETFAFKIYDEILWVDFLINPYANR